MSLWSETASSLLGQIQHYMGLANISLQDFVVQYLKVVSNYLTFVQAQDDDGGGEAKWGKLYSADGDHVCVCGGSFTNCRPCGDLGT